MILDEDYTLSNGVESPKLGLGTWFVSDDSAANAVKQEFVRDLALVQGAFSRAIENGYITRRKVT